MVCLLGRALAQAGALAEVGRYARGRGLSVMVFTGHTPAAVLSFWWR